jgi:hypothetical protein
MSKQALAGPSRLERWCCEICHGPLGSFVSFAPDSFWIPIISNHWVMLFRPSHFFRQFLFFPSQQSVPFPFFTFASSHFFFSAGDVYSGKDYT